MKIWTVEALAERLKMTPHGVRTMIRKGTLKAQKHGRDYVILDEDAKAVMKDRPKRGRPREKDKDG